MACLIQLRGLSFAYDAPRPVLQGLDLDLCIGDRIGLTGGNGCGKTTLLHLMLGLLRPARGTITVFGRRRATEAEFTGVRRGVGLLFQDSDDQLFCPTVEEDVAFGPRNLGQSPREARETTRRVLEELGIETLATRITQHLSGGEKRLVALAGVLAMAPRVLLLDEPTAGIDTAGTERLSEILANLSQAMVLVSHDCGFRQRIANRELRLEDGRLTETT